MRRSGIEVDRIAFRKLVFVCSDAQFQPPGQNVQQFDPRVFVEPDSFFVDRLEFGQVRIQRAVGTGKSRLSK